MSLKAGGVALNLTVRLLGPPVRSMPMGMSMRARTFRWPCYCWS